MIYLKLLMYEIINTWCSKCIYFINSDTGEQIMSLVLVPKSLIAQFSFLTKQAPSTLLLCQIYLLWEVVICCTWVHSCCQGFTEWDGQNIPFNIFRLSLSSGQHPDGSTHCSDWSVNSFKIFVCGEIIQSCFGQNILTELEKNSYRSVYWYNIDISIKANLWYLDIFIAANMTRYPDTYLVPMTRTDGRLNGDELAEVFHLDLISHFLAELL